MRRRLVRARMSLCMARVATRASLQHSAHAIVRAGGRRELQGAREAEAGRLQFAEWSMGCCGDLVPTCTSPIVCAVRG